NKPRPAGLMAGSESGSVITVEVLVEEHQVAPVRIILKLGGAAIYWTTTIIPAQEDVSQAARYLFCYLEQIHLTTRTGRTLNDKVVAVVGVVLQQRADDQTIDWHPDRPSPVGVAAKHAAIGFRGQIRNTELLPSNINLIRMIGVKARQ